jgi:LmbE family N-acetylglucosaminyl deacetylase
MDATMDAGLMRVAVLSPHFDDAVLSCWHVLSAPGPVAVVNVFAAAPPDGCPLGWWDERTGATDSTVRARERAREDEAALALAGRRPTNLDLLEVQYRREPASVDVVAERIAREVHGSDVLYAPAVLGAHDDHALVRDAALRLGSEGVRLRLYADLPHGLSRGWPTWVAVDGRAEVDAAWARALAEAVHEGEALHPYVHELTAGAQRRKLEAVRAYRTQLGELDAMAFAPLHRSLRYEVVWELAPA